MFTRPPTQTIACCRLKQCNLVCHKIPQFTQTGWGGTANNEQNSLSTKEKVWNIWQLAMHSALTWTRRLDLCLIFLCVSVEEVRGRVFTALDFALEGVQTLDVLFLKRAGSTAGCAHIQVCGQLPPLLIFVHLMREETVGWDYKDVLFRPRCLHWTGELGGIPGWGHRSLWQTRRVWTDPEACGPQREGCSYPWPSLQQRPGIGPPTSSSQALDQAHTAGWSSHWWWWRSSTSVRQKTNY